MHVADNESAGIYLRGALPLYGLSLFVFAVVAASGPGRIDIVDGQTRFEVGRSLVEHGDSAIRDSRIWWGSFPGRDGLNFTYYRLPHSLAAADAIWMADLGGPVSEGRRHFFFVWVGAASAAILAAIYAVYFRRLGYQSGYAVLWALGGIFCTPNWFYATSTYDEILCSTAVVTAAAGACLTKERRPIGGAIAAGLFLGLAFNVKQTMGAFIFVVLALHDNPAASTRQRLVRAGIICLGLLAGIAFQEAYDYSKFPFDKRTVHADLLNLYAPVYTSNPLPALACLTVSPGCGMFWYCPPLLLGLCGVFVSWRRHERRLAGAVLLTSVAFVGFHCFVSFFKGDPSWGPRYLTPWFAFLWLFSPLGATILTRRLVGLLLGLGLLVQILGLAVDPHRMYVARCLPSSAGVIDPWIYFQPWASQLIQRPSEIAEIMRDRGIATEYTPAPSPTFTFPIIDPPYLPTKGPEVVNRYQVLRSFRPWWISQRFLPTAQRPVNIEATLSALGLMTLVGLVLMGRTLRFGSDLPHAEERPIE